MNRIDRISAILIQLQSRRVVKASDIAERFCISLRTVYRDIRTLEEAGVPIIGEAGVGYSIMDGYRLPPVMFTREEATAFLTAEKLVEKLTDASNGANYRSAMYKIRAVLRSAEKDFLEHISHHIEVLQTRQQREQAQSDINLMQPILKGVAEKKAIAINYFAFYRQEHTERIIEPVGIFYLDNYWHVIGYCLLRNDYRDFRLDRISRLTLTDQPFTQQHPLLKEFLEKLYEDRNLHSVMIRVEKKIVPYIGEQKYYHGFVSERDAGDTVEWSFLTASLEGFARWYMMFGDCAVIVQPETLRERVAAIISAFKLNLQAAEQAAMA